MEENPIKVELGSHTDCRGSFEYNEVLSQNRAESAVRYLTAAGISPDRITAKGYGEYKLTNKCADGVRCTEADTRLTAVPSQDPGLYGRNADKSLFNRIYSKKVM